MDDKHRRLSEHLRNGALYEAGAPDPPGDGWRRRLLAARFGPSARGSRRPGAGLSPVMRLILVIAVPLGLITLVGIGGYLRLDPALLWPDWLPRLDLGSMEGVGAAQWRIETPRFLDQLGYARHLIWPLLVAGSALLTFMVRRRPLRLLPLDW